jgi:hypothetical protein
VGWYFVTIRSFYVQTHTHARRVEMEERAKIKVDQIRAKSKISGTWRTTG